MISILDHEAVRFAGAQEVSRSPTGRTRRRLPKWASQQIHDPIFQYTISSPSGVRIAFASDTDAIELDAMLTGIEWPDVPGLTPRFDLVVDGATVATRHRWLAKHRGANAALDELAQQRRCEDLAAGLLPGDPRRHDYALAVGAVAVFDHLAGVQSNALLLVETLAARHPFTP